MDHQESFEEHEETWDDDESGSSHWGGVPGRVLLLDVSRGVVSASLDTCLALFRHIMANAPNHFIGVALYGTQKSDDRGLDNVVQIIDLKRLTVDDMMTVKKMSENPRSVEERWGTADKYNFANALWQASRMFSHCKTKMSVQTVDVLSHLDEPEETNRRAILQKASDLRDLGIDVNLVNVSERPLPRDSFYEEFAKIARGGPDESWEPPEPVASAEDILPLIQQTVHKKLASAKLKMHLGPHTAIGVGLYHLCKPKCLPKKVPMHRESNERVESTVQTFRESDDQKKKILHSEICMYQRHGDRDIELTHSELIHLRKFGGAPSIKLLGFKPSSELDMARWYLQPCAFLYPDEDAVSGSSSLFNCLRNRCAKKDRLPVCTIVPRWYSHPRLVALVPQNRLTDKGRQVRPDGFNVVYLPYAENVRDVAVEPVSDTTEAQVECMQKIIKKLRFNYSSDSFDNPKLQSFHCALEALALEESQPREFQDTTHPDYDMQSRRIGFLSDDFRNLFGNMGPSAEKRRGNTGDEGGSKRRAEESLESPDLPMLASRIANKEVSKYTVPQLKHILKWRNAQNMPALTGLKKEQLVELVYKHCSQIV